MNDQELADKVVALVGLNAIRCPGGVADDYHFVRDWRVAGALMEKTVQKEVDKSLIGSEHNDFEQILCAWNGREFWVDIPTVSAMMFPTAPSGASLPRAIIEACVEALSKRS